MMAAIPAYIAVLVLLLAGVQGSEGKNYKDVSFGCNCVCPPHKDAAGRIYYRNVTQKDCDCLHVVGNMSVPGTDTAAYCLLCECEYKERRSVAIMVTIIVSVSILGPFLLYLVYLAMVKLMLKRRLFAHSQLIENDDKVGITE